MGKCEKILSGPEFSWAESGSVAEHLIPKMKAQGKDDIVQIDGATGETITAQEFLRMSLGVTEGLIKFGLEEEDVVALLSPNNIKTVAITLGVLFSGGVLAPVDYNLKPAEWRHLFKQFQPKYLLCEDTKKDVIRNCLKEANLNPKIILIDSKSTYNEEFYILDDIREEVDVANYTPRKVRDAKKQAAVILCSSGSTGLPKGVALSHFTLVLNCLAAEGTKELSVKPFIISSPVFWISGTFLIIISCYLGSVRFVPKSLDPEDILRGIQNSKPLFLLISPSNVIQIATHPNVNKYDLSSIKVIFPSGGVLGIKGAEKIKKTFPNAVISTTYGLTETGGSIATLSGPFKDMVLGNVLPGVQIKVVDPATEESLGPNKTGECRVKTPSIMIGYYNNEEATKAAFDEDGWFKTGDLVYYDEDEVLYIVGRIKEVVKFRNYQVSLSEIEAFLIGLPGVKDVAVVPIPHETDMNHLKALIVKNPESEITAQDIIQLIEDNFSYQKQLHEGVEFVDSLPRSEVGKLKRKQLEQNYYVY